MIRFSFLNLLLKDPPVTEVEQPDQPNRHSRDWIERQIEPAINAFRKTVKENLEWVLNTRRIPPPPKVSLAGVKQYPADRESSLKEGRHPTQEEQRQQIETSLYFYGLPSFAYIALSPGARESDVNRLAAEIEGTIRVFEPRILDPKVTVEQMPSLDREIRFRVTGKLKIDPDPAFVQYRTMLDIDTGRYQVEVSEETRG